MRRLINGRAAALFVAVGFMAACSDSSGPAEQSRQLGVLQISNYSGPAPTEELQGGEDERVRWSNDPGSDDLAPTQVLVVPDTVEAGQPFEVTTVTFGDGCTVADGQEVQISGTVVSLKPFDLRMGEICTMILKFLPHTSTVTLNTPGEWVVRVTGRKIRQGDSSWETPISAEKTIIVK